MLNTLPTKAQKYECGIVNLDNSVGSGTHWVAYHKINNNSIYFDSFGNLQPPTQIVNYLKGDIQYNYDPLQNYDSIICGHLCLKFLYSFYL